MIPANIRAICFDAVGTLIIPDPPAHLVYAEVGAQHDSRYDVPTIHQRFSAAFSEEEKADQINGWQTSEDREYQRWHKIVTTVLDDAADVESCFDKLYAHFTRPDAWLCFEETALLLEKLHQRQYRLAMASNFDHRLRSVLTGMPFYHLLEEIIISSEVGWRKPSPHFFEAICQKMDLPADQILFVGDDLVNDYQGAKEAGMPALLVDPHEKKSGLVQLLSPDCTRNEPFQ